MHYSEYRQESQITGIAWSWIGEDKVHVRVLEQDLSNEELMFCAFLDAYNQADVVTGHYLRKHDMPLLSDHAFRFGIELKPKIVQDTMLDTVKVKGLGKSQDNLAMMLGVVAEKHHMSGHEWRVANALTPEGREGTRKRVVNDVIQNKQLRVALLERGALGPGKLWSPS
jgi:hypothetical protein